ncbi:hypothetical protein Emag_005701 [Eimeria magna]
MPVSLPLGHRRSRGRGLARGARPVLQQQQQQQQQQQHALKKKQMPGSLKSRDRSIPRGARGYTATGSPARLGAPEKRGAPEERGGAPGWISFVSLVKCGPVSLLRRGGGKQETGARKKRQRQRLGQEKRDEARG